MSIHSTEYLHGNVKVGGVKGIEENQGWRGASWWFNQAMERALIAAGNSPSHYAKSLDVNMIRKDLFGWEAKPGVLSCTVDLLIEDKIVPVSFTIPNWKAVVREDKLIECYLNDQMDLASDTVMNIASKDFSTESLAEVLIDNVAYIVQESPHDLVITGAGVLKWGKVGYLEISIPREIHNDATGIAFRPNLLGSTSFDGSVATRYDRTVTNVVCDNTHQAALSQSGDKTGSFKVRRTKNFGEMMKGAREALGILERTTDEFTALIEEWSKIEVSPKQFEMFKDLVVPVPELKEVTKIKSIAGQQFETKEVNSRAFTIAANKRDTFDQLWTSDPRVSPWKGTKLGIVQLGNTFNHHFATQRNVQAHDGNKLAARVEGNQMKVMDGSFAKADQTFITAIDKVLIATA